MIHEEDLESLGVTLDGRHFQMQTIFHGTKRRLLRYSGHCTVMAGSIVNVLLYFPHKYISVVSKQRKLKRCSLNVLEELIQPSRKSNAETRENTSIEYLDMEGKTFVPNLTWIAGNRMKGFSSSWIFHRTNGYESLRHGD